PYHHLVEYGTNSIMVTVGEIYNEEAADNIEGKKKKSFVDMGITIDERIGDGFYFAKSIRLFKFLLSAPDLLEVKFMEEVKFDD
ncbi:MAG TPA: hypothetical protein VFC96_04595, partial [Anaerovoracaceae bacterium]|nr:hypothetical protein [Anaerovoracaceae bacterium]